MQETPGTELAYAWMVAVPSSSTSVTSSVVTTAGAGTSPFPGANDRAWGAALTLIVLAFLLTVIARLVSSRFALKR